MWNCKILKTLSKFLNHAPGRRVRADVAGCSSDRATYGFSSSSRVGGWYKSSMNWKRSAGTGSVVRLIDFRGWASCLRAVPRRPARRDCAVLQLLHNTRETEQRDSHTIDYSPACLGSLQPCYLLPDGMRRLLLRGHVFLLIPRLRRPAGQD